LDRASDEVVGVAHGHPCFVDERRLLGEGKEIHSCGSKWGAGGVERSSWTNWTSSRRKRRKAGLEGFTNGTLVGLTPPRVRPRAHSLNPEPA